MSSMRERIYRALATVEQAESDRQTKSGQFLARNSIWAIQVDAVLEALREPDEAMLDALASAIMSYEPEWGNSANDCAREGWPKAIDAARAP